MRNTGSTTWAAGSVGLGSQNPPNNITWGFNRVPLANAVAPGENATFNFSITAPTTPGPYNFQWRMVEGDFGWFGASSTNVAVQNGWDNAQFVSQDVPSTMAPGQTYPVIVTMQNTGSITWPPGTYRLGSQNPQDNSVWGLSRVELPSSVAPGASVTFAFNAVAPAAAGPYNFQWRMLKDVSGWFGPSSPNVAISVGTVQANMYFIHADHLNTPRLVADAAGATVWKWDQQEPFGNNVADENPSGLGAFDLPLRLPGQYFDKETNLHYNYYRDYDPSIGRYGESDPIGLGGGLNTYAYVAASPLLFSDPLGLLKYNAPPPRTVPVPPAVEAKVACLENCLGTQLVITGGAEQTGHSKGSKHYSGQAVDFGFNSNPGIRSRSAEFYCCALQCGFDYGQTEGGRGPHYHLQTVPGLGVPRIPRDACMCKP